MNDKKIVNLVQGMTLTPKKTYTRCNHSNITLDDHKRVLICDHCEKVIEPFDFLLKYANGQQRIVWRVESIKSEIGRIESDLDELKRQKRNLQSQVNRLKKKAG